MDSIVIRPLSAVRLLLISGLFVVIWMIFGAGSAHAAEPPPPSNGPSQNQPAPTAGLLPVLTAPATPPVSAAQPKADPAAATMPAKAAAPAPVSAATAPVLGTLSYLATTAPAVLEQATAPVAGLVDNTVPPVAAPVANLITDTIRLLPGTVATLPGSVLSLVPPVENSPSGVSVLPEVSSPGTAGAVVGGNADVSSPPEDSTPPATHGATVHAGTQGPAASLPSSFPRSGAPDTAASMSEAGAPLQTPSPIPGGLDPFSLPSPISGGAGSQGQAGAGQPSPAGHLAAADLSYRFVLPMARGGDGSLFSFALPGSPEQEPGFSPD
ncbi:hypothetical protein [Arthrobacter bambusae]|uniref:hypothetical protein n=1 Tax=Arthrobacter bambusae TaxID=1338426 RepID=UPI00278A6C5A|nr:hypothetical protein [Arthrobacter bambusae]MDQ0213093.1 hypothetical protein [Arthrobacter bambusae]MDQ0237457.1 hypothetical protein [Arthrobacter bambusae]